MKTTKKQEDAFAEMVKPLQTTNQNSTKAMAEKPEAAASENAMADLAKGFQNNNQLVEYVLRENSNQPVATPTVVVQTQDEQATAKRKAKKDKNCISNNHASGEAVTAIVKTYQPPYLPSNVAIQEDSLDALNVMASDFLDAVGDASQQKKEDIDLRQFIYFDLKSLARRIRSELIASGASKKAIKNASHYVDFLTGERILEVKPDSGKKQISAVHTTFEQQIQNFNGLIKGVKSQPEYAPNIEELKVVALEQKLMEMKRSNSGYYKAQASYSTSLGDRNKFFNEPITGYVDTFLAVKRSVKAAYGNTSTEYKQIKGFAFNVSKIKTCN